MSSGFYLATTDNTDKTIQCLMGSKRVPTGLWHNMLS